MIIGLGSDLCNIERIQNSLDRFGERFENRVFTEIERTKARRRPFTIAGTYAKRFAAKEAFSKAVGTGFRRGVFMKEDNTAREVTALPRGSITTRWVRDRCFDDALSRRRPWHEFVVRGKALTKLDRKKKLQLVLT